MRETYNLEFKSKLSDSFLKTVSAYANYNDGIIQFGVDDSGESLHIDNLKELTLRIENKINDSITPIPEYNIEIDEQNEIVLLKVYEGELKPYFYKGKAYMRRDSSSLPVDDREELKRLILEGMNQDYEDLPSKDKNLSFNILESALKEKMNIDSLSLDILKTLGLYDDKKGYNLAANIISDENNYKIFDIVKFGDNINEFKERIIIENTSILSAYYQAIEVFNRYFKYEKVDGFVRKTIELIPEDAFREAIANALVHRDWSISAPIKVELHDQYIDISSPGGLPKGISSEEYISGQISILRNEKIGSLFNRLGLIEKFGTGIRRIKYLYQGRARQPQFQTYPNSIIVRLPILIDKVEGISKNASIILQKMPRNKEISRLEIEKISGFDKYKTLRELEELMSEELVKKVGLGRGTKYIKI
ncbi:RNA-binding domain-containing protein [Helcococcus massiliensis]|uniref:RNA-binding domain-containing protein n=1 Tax=Helcococcus massiliensis TaxID=2040290 RepID=UPI00190EDC63|nr:RNA-binding domain-containing protein [Helcococcus massiliensis]